MKNHQFVFSMLVVLVLFVTLPTVGQTDIGQPLATTTPQPTATTMPTPFSPRDPDLLPIFESVMRDVDEDCTLPCWWGFQLGKTPIDEVSSFLQETGFDRHWQFSPYQLTFEEYLRNGEPFILDFADSYYIPGSSFLISFFFNRRNLLSQMYIEFYPRGDWLSPELDRMSFPYILSSIGDNPEIYINALSNPVNETVFVIFRDLGLLIIYDFVIPENFDAPPYLLCWNLEHTKSMRTTLPDDEVDDFQPGDEGLFTLEELYDINTATLVQFFRDNPDSCLDISEYKGK